MVKGDTHGEDDGKGNKELLVLQSHLLPEEKEAPRPGGP